MKALFSCLKGVALTFVSGFSLRAENYPLVWEVLKENFENKSKLIETLILKLLNIKTHWYNFNNLFTVKAELICHIEFLKTQGTLI